MVSAWPGTVNQFIYRAGYQQKPEANKISFQPEVGPPIERRRSSISTDLVQCASRGTPTEFAALMAFWRTTLKDGTDTFTRNHPLTGAAGTVCKFTEPPALTEVGPLYLHYSLSLRIIN